MDARSGEEETLGGYIFPAMSRKEREARSSSAERERSRSQERGKPLVRRSMKLKRIGSERYWRVLEQQRAKN